MDSAFYVDHVTEKQRYEEHLNDVHDQGFQNFVSPITKSIIEDFASHAIGLDFGSGTAPVISHILEQKGYKMHQFDVFFAPDRQVLNKKYDFIACCEVVEHFHHPREEFKTLRALLNPGGKIYIMTNMITKPERFQNWYYRRDPTHVFFYTPKTFEYIKTEFGFSELKIDKRLIILD
jgi:cyclopropane fatty-acyl-phospholipid synthase-like methyltransferase